MDTTRYDLPLTDLQEAVIYCLFEGNSPQDNAVSKAGGILDTQLDKKGIKNRHFASPHTVSSNPTLNGGHAIYIIGHGSPNGYNGTLMGGFWTLTPNDFILAMEQSWSGSVLLAAEVYLVACDINGNPHTVLITETYAQDTANILLKKKQVKKVVFPDGYVRVINNPPIEQNVQARQWFQAKLK